MSEAAQNLPVVSVEKAGEVMEAVIAKGDLSQLGPNDRARYYRTVCDSIGLNPLTKPFEYITLNGKLTLYARKDATDQLRKIYGVSVIDMVETREEGLVIVTVKVRDAGGRTDMAKGAVTLKGLSGEALANAFMKCETKAKRRATLSICGLGFLDETEVETISNAQTSRLPKKDARDIYTRMQTEVDEAADIDDWLLKNEGRLLVLPADWENILRLRIQERKQTPPAAEEPTELWADEDDTPPEWSSKWDALGPVAQAGTLCSKVAFWEFLSDRATGPVTNKDQAADYVRIYCKVASRADLATNEPAAKLWRNLVASYRAWQREPSVTNAVTASPTGVSDAADTPPAQAHPDAGGDVHIPAWDDYVDRWDAILEEATDAKQLGELWNSDVHKKLRREIDWPDFNQTGHDQARALTDRVRRKIDGLKKTAEAGA